MHKSSAVLIALLATLAGLSPSLALQRAVYVSAKGTDSVTCGLPTAPCGTVQYSLDNIVAAGGVILIEGGAIASAGITIKNSVSIIADSGATAIFQVAGKANGVFIDAGASGDVTLKGLTFTSMSSTGTSGIVVNSAAKVDVIDCLVQNFAGDGVDMISNTPSQYSIIRTTILDSAGTGIFVSPQAGGSEKGSIVDTDVFRSRGDGVTIDGANGASSAYIQNTRSNFSSGAGFSKITNGTFRLATSTATGNAVNITSAGGGGPGYSYQNNFLTGNSDDSGTVFLTSNSPQ